MTQKFSENVPRSRFLTGEISVYMKIIVSHVCLSNFSICTTARVKTRPGFLRLMRQRNVSFKAALFVFKCISNGLN